LRASVGPVEEPRAAALDPARCEVSNEPGSHLTAARKSANIPRSGCLTPRSSRST
jgi:hypothetical protein